MAQSNNEEKRINFYAEITKVKWFYKLDEDSYKRKKRYGDRNWIFFSKLDSYNIELEYRSSRIQRRKPNLVQVLDGLYEVNLRLRECYPIYWEAKKMPVMRSLWYTDNGEPFEEITSEQIESKHVELFQNELETEFSYPNESNASASSSYDPKSNKKPLSSINIKVGNIIWYSKDEVYLEKKNTNVIEIMQSKLSKFKHKIKLNRIKRCIKTLKEDDQQDLSQQEVTHLVFVVHGVAQKLQKNKIIECCNIIRNQVKRTKKEFFPKEKQRFMFIPVDWRNSLVLDDGIVDAITIKTIKYVRHRLNSSALDIMYYSSPYFKTEIMNSLGTELNRLYDLFCVKNPNFKQNNGAVSFIGHSLGVVIIYDVLTCSINLFQSHLDKLKERKEYIDDETLRNEYFACKKRIEEIDTQLIRSKSNVKLKFKSANFFCLGSPLAVYLALRGVRPSCNGTIDHILPKSVCENLFNIFHPSDALAYRMEPLLLKHYSKKKVSLIQKQITKDFIGLNEVNTQDNNTKPRSIFHSLKTKLSLHKNEQTTDSSSETSSIEDNYYPSEFEQNQTENDCNHTEVKEAELESPIDFQLEDSRFKLISILTAHTAYWKNTDTAFFITKQLCSKENILKSN